MPSLRSAGAGRLFRARTSRFFCAAAFVAAAVACGGDGGTGPAPTPDPQNPTPAIASLDPGKLHQWSDSAVVTVTGTGFINGSVVRLDGTDRLTTYVSSSQLTVVVPTAKMQQAGTVAVTVFNPAPGGGASGSLALPVEHRVPELSLISPAGIEHGSPAFTLNVHGFGFTQGAMVRWNGNDRPTTFVNRGHLSAQISQADVAAAGTAQVTVFNPTPGGGISEARVFSVAVRPNPVARLTSLTPSTIQAGTGATFTLAGTGFVPGAQVNVGGFNPTTTVVSSTELRFTLEAGNLPTAGFAQVSVTNPAPGGGVSNPVNLTVTNPVPALTSISPAQATLGADSLVVRLTGTGFVAGGTFAQGTSVLMNDVTRSSRRVSATELEVVLNAQELREIRTFSFQAWNHEPGGGRSNTLALPVVYPAPVISAISPANAFAGADSLVVRVTGTGFTSGTMGRFDGTGRTTRYVSPTALDVVLRADDLDAAGTFAITVTNLPPGGGTSAPATFTLTTPTPAVTLLPSNGASAGRPGFAMVVHGTGFLSSSVVRWNGSPRTTRFISGTRLEANITTADLASPGTALVTVHTPGGGTSQAQQVIVRPVGSMAFTSTLSLPIQARDIAYDHVSGRIYASVPSTAGAHANMVLAINPQTGAVVDSVLVGGSPGEMAISDDGSTLWVALDATGQVRRLSLPGLALGTSFSLGQNRVSDIRVMPGQPGTVAVSRRNTCCSPAHEGVAIYDNGVKRARETADHTGADLIVFGESAAVMYGQGAYGGFYTLQVDGGGVEIVRQGTVDRGGWNIEYANGRVYTSAGGVMDAGRHEAVGSLPGGGSAVFPDATLGRIFILEEFAERLSVYDMNTYQLLDQANVGIRYAHRMVRWGTNGLALASGDAIHIYRAPIFGP